MKVNLENKQDLGASTLRHITYMPQTNLKRSVANTTYHCVLIRGLREGIRLSTNPSNIDIIARTRTRRCTYGQLSDSTYAQRESENQDLVRSKTGDTVSPKLFTATLESIFRRLNWENKGMKIDGELLTNLRFAVHIVLCTEAPQELQHML